MLRETLTDAVHELGFDCHAYVNIQPVRTYSVSNYPVEWEQRYTQRDYKNIDPVVTTARASGGHFDLNQDGVCPSMLTVASHSRRCRWSATSTSLRL